jgi:hypothetical protein
LLPEKLAGKRPDLTGRQQILILDQEDAANGNDHAFSWRSP